MSKHDAGYSAGKKQWAEMCGDGGRVQVKAYSRGGAVKKPAKVSTKGFPKAPPQATPTSQDTPNRFAKGGKLGGGKKIVKKADGGEVKEARRIARDVQDQVIDANSRLIRGNDSKGRGTGTLKGDEFVRDTGTLLESKLRKKYPNRVFNEVDTIGLGKMTNGVKGDDDYARGGRVKKYAKGGPVKGLAAASVKSMKKGNC